MSSSTDKIPGQGNDQSIVPSSPKPASQPLEQPVRKSANYHAALICGDVNGTIIGGGSVIADGKDVGLGFSNPTNIGMKLVVAINKDKDPYIGLTLQFPRDGADCEKKGLSISEQKGFGAVYECESSPA